LEIELLREGMKTFSAVRLSARYPLIPAFSSGGGAGGQRPDEGDARHWFRQRQSFQPNQAK
jgi:hypothetical protein